MKNIRIGLIAVIILALSSCNSHNHAKTDAKTDAGQKAINVKASELASTKDLVCGMKMEDGHIGDTASFQGKVYGFCSSECKAEFLKDPQSHLTQQ